MSVTITLGGVTITGAGVTFVAPPPTMPTAGWFGGGYNPGPGSLDRSTVERMTFATDTSALTTKGPLSGPRRKLATAGTPSSGWFAGGYLIGGAPGPKSTVDRITYATDTDTASVRGPLTGGIYYIAGTSNYTTNGWFGGGGSFGGQVSGVQSITYATDTATAVSRGPLSRARTGILSTGTSSYGWFMGGRIDVPAAGAVSTIDRIDYSNDTATASVRGPLAAARYQGAGSVTDFNTYGWYGGGNPGPVSNQLQRVTFATDTATATNRGTLSGGYTYIGGSANNDTYGWIAGGSPTGSAGVSTIQRMTFATDTAATTNVNNLSLGKLWLAGTSGVQ